MPSALETHERFIRDRLEDPHSRKAEALEWLEGSGGKNTLGELGTTEEAKAESRGFDAEPDIGQSHLFSMLD